MLRPFRRSRHRLDQPRLRYGPAGLSASMVASQEMGEPSENQVHCGSTEPVLACTPNSPSPLMDPSLIVAREATPAGGPRPHKTAKVTQNADQTHTTRQPPAP